MKRLLINWVYYHAIGHTVEALRCAQNWRLGNPGLEIGLALNASAGTELAACLPGIDRVYPVELGEFEPGGGARKSLEAVPRDWDYYVVDPRHKRPMGWEPLDLCEAAFRDHIKAGFVADDWDSWAALPLPAKVSPLALRLPAKARAFAEGFLAPGGGTRVSLLFGSGAEPSRTPPLSFWRALIAGLIDAFGETRIILLGASKEGRSATRGISRKDVDDLLREFPQARDGFDAGLLNQLAIAERCDLHISPHTGFSFAIQCLGVPWLVVSGGDVAENVVNGVPFASVYPDCDRYPCGPWFAPEKNPMKAECEQRRRGGEAFACLSAEALSAKLPEILSAARILARGERPYLDCVRRHYQAMLPRLGKHEGEPFMDGWPHVLSEDYRFEPLA